MDLLFYFVRKIVEIRHMQMKLNIYAKIFISELSDMHTYMNIYTHMLSYVHTHTQFPVAVRVVCINEIQEFL